MAANAQVFAQMADQTARQITGSYREWTAFLTTAARLYKYPYHEQLMIYAQRPEATACAEYDFWNRRMGRYVRRGSRGIALVDTSGGKPSLRYVFDVADTGGGERARRPYLWQLRPEHEAAVRQALADHFDVPDDPAQPLVSQLEQIASRLATDYWEEHQQEILGIVDGSFLEEYDEFNIGAAFRSAASVSTAYALLSRCGLEPARYFEHEDFLSVFDWNTPAAVAALGTAVSEASEQVLRRIEITIKHYEREKIAERSQNHDQRADLHPERGLPDPQPDPERTAGGRAPGQVRADAEELPGEAPAHPVPEDASGGEPVPPPAGDRRDGPAEAGRDGAPAGEGGGGDGGVEGSRPDELGGPDEQLQGTGGGNHPERAGVQLTEQAGQFSLFPIEREQRESILEGSSAEAPGPFSVSQGEIDAELCRGSGYQDGKLRIYAMYLGMPDTKAALAFLKREYGSYYGHSQTYQDGSSGIVNYSPKGITFQRFSPSGSFSITWNRAAARLKELVSGQDYFTPAEKERWDAIVREFQQRGEALPPPVPRVAYPPPYRTEQLTLDAQAAGPVTPAPDSIPAPPFHRQYLPEILRHEDGAASWEALVKFFADHPEETLRASYLRLRFGEVPHQYPAEDGTTIGFQGFPNQLHVWEGTLTDKDNAGAAILEACKEIKDNNPVEIGSYRGFAMFLSVENFGSDFILTLKGEMSHRATLGTDAKGNLTRIDNALAGMPDRVKSLQVRLGNLREQLKDAKAELGKPFPQEAELAEKSARLAELNVQLDIDSNHGTAQRGQTVAKAERPSVLEGLRRPVPPRTVEKKQRNREEVR